MIALELTAPWMHWRLDRRVLTVNWSDGVVSLLVLKPTLSARCLGLGPVVGRVEPEMSVDWDWSWLALRLAGHLGHLTELQPELATCSP